MPTCKNVHELAEKKKNSAELARPEPESATRSHASKKQTCVLCRQTLYFLSVTTLCSACFIRCSSCMLHIDFSYMVLLLCTTDDDVQHAHIQPNRIDYSCNTRVDGTNRCRTHFFIVNWNSLCAFGFIQYCFEQFEVRLWAWCTECLLCTYLFSTLLQYLILVLGIAPIRAHG